MLAVAYVAGRASHAR